MRRIFTILSVMLLSAVSAGTIAVAATADPVSLEQERIDCAPAIRLFPGQVELTVNSQESESFSIYSITGQLIRSVTVSSRSEVVDLPQGCYIVKCSKWSKTIIVR